MKQTDSYILYRKVQKYIHRHFDKLSIEHKKWIESYVSTNISKSEFPNTGKKWDDDEFVSFVSALPDAKNFDDYWSNLKLVSEKFGRPEKACRHRIRKKGLSKKLDYDTIEVNPEIAYEPGWRLSRLARCCPDLEEK